ncbi:BCD family MFS transporter [Prosthecomicrobium sp. N25]|uniref:BCD family MFS transporter n=1 Tax=Prosthecomicrobium sp. N25 TaxID=3129254 RepID=UPI003077571D
MQPAFGWIAIVRLGLVQTALGAIVVLTTSTLNRVMVVELALPALVPGLLVTLHHGLQMLRPRWGYGSDRGGGRTPWILGGMAVLGAGGVLAAAAVALMSLSTGAGIALGVAAFGLVGIGVGAAGTSLLVLLSERVAPERKAQAATIVWIMMIAGFVVTAATAGRLLEPFSMTRLVQVAAGVSVAAVLLSVAALWRLEPRTVVPSGARTADPERRAAFRQTLAAVWAEPEARRFTAFIFVSMLAYSMQDLILEPFAGTVFGMSPGETTRLGGIQNGGVLVGMILVAVLGHRTERTPDGVLRRWMVGGCLASAVSLALIAAAGAAGPPFPLKAAVAALGLSNGAFAIAAIGSMMALAAGGRSATGDRDRNGTRMGVWGAAQAIAFGLGGLVGTAAADAARLLVGSPALAYAAVFAVEAGVFVVAAGIAARIRAEGAGTATRQSYLGAGGPQAA